MFRPSMHQPGYTQRITELQTDAVILTQRDWNRLKKESVHITAAQAMDMKLTEEQQKTQQLKNIEAKREKILSAEGRRNEKRNLQANQKKVEERNRALEIAEGKADEELDEVKAMNADMMAARVRALRDAQLLEKKVLQQKKLEEERQYATESEKRRLRAVQIYKDREDALLQQRKKGKDVLLSQIYERQEIQKEEQRLRELEKQEMALAAEKIKEEDMTLEQLKKHRQQEFLKESLEANRAAIRRKQLEREREIEEVQAMAAYQAEQARKAEEYERTINQQKQMKEYEVAEIRKKQQKTIDTQAQRDELLARRIQEEKERKERQLELEKIRKQEQIREELKADREKAITIKQKRLLEMAKLEKAEFDRTMRMQAEERRRQEEQERKRIEAAKQYRDELLNTIETTTEKKRLEPLTHLDEQKHLQEENEDYLLRLERIRQRKLEQLQAEGVPEKYLTELRNRQFRIK